MNRIGICLVAGCLLITACASRSDDGPTVDQFKSALDAQLQALRPDGFTERTVLFEGVRAGESNGPRHTFAVTATIHDYGPGYPANGYYGQTCVGRMDGWNFDMLPDATGKWIVQGRMTVSDAQCQDNPAEGQPAVAVASLGGARAAAVAPPSAPSGNALPLGEYACYGTGGRMMTGMGFVLAADGTYADLDGARGGRWQHDEAGAAIVFSGGHLDGQRGTGASAQGFALSETVSCEPYR